MFCCLLDSDNDVPRVKGSRLSITSVRLLPVTVFMVKGISSIQVTFKLKVQVNENIL